MPTYEYACTSCGAHIDVYQRFSDEPLFECGVCGGPLRKVFHPAGILFKGSGFYKTDSRSSRTAAAAGSGTESRTAEKSTGSEKTAASSKEAGSSSSGGSAPKEKSA